ncbi:MAG: hypothetical protein P4L84_22145 [Isosphaeraceae bacterium]|nr:hypothetical protein [Isosphaeraceae bacterium]
MELREAMTQISEIRAQMARTEMFRGYRAVPVAFSGLLALTAAGLQAIWMPEPTTALGGYLALWVGTAVVSAVAAGSQMALRARLSTSRWSRAITWLAIEQFVPCLVTGGLLTFVLVRFAAESVWMLPGLWQILFSLGIFASCRLLPRATFGVGVFYLAAGLASLILAQGPAALSPWSMGLPFGVGQLLVALVLYRTLECHDVES